MFASINFILVEFLIAVRKFKYFSVLVLANYSKIMYVSNKINKSRR